MTDDGGNVFRHLAAQTAKREAVIPEVDNFAGEIQEKETLERENGTVEEHLEEANKKREEAEQAEKGEENNIAAQKPQGEVKNPIEDANQWKKSSILSLVVRDESSLSNKAISLDAYVRTSAEGSRKSSGAGSNIRRIMVCKIFRNPYEFLSTGAVKSCIRL